MQFAALSNTAVPMRAPELPWRAVVASTVIALVFALFTFSVVARSTEGWVVWSDGLAYFLYARSAVIDHDLDITDEFAHLDPLYPKNSKLMEPLRRWSTRNADGSLQPPWPVGAGLIMVPFYAAGYGIEKVVASSMGRPADSYGLIPQYAFAFGSVVYGLLGFWCIVLMCRGIGNERTAYLAALGTVLSGPVVFYVFFNPSMAHASSFGVIALLTLIWLRGWRNGATATTLLSIGLLLGVAATIRYQNALFAILPVALVFRELRRRGWAAALKLASVGALACVVPIVALMRNQLAVRTVNGHAAFTSAQYPVDPSSPYFLDVLFSCRHGAFYWAPLLAIGALGLIYALTKRNGWAGVLLLSVLAHVYLIGGLGLANVAVHDAPPPPGWLHHWSDAPSFGMRYLTECAPMLALGLSAAMQATLKQIGFKLWATAVALFAAWNGLLIAAYGLETITRSGCLHYGDMLNGIGAAIRLLISRVG